ncbi:Ig-like domain-containing protein [Paenarthrobacter sp. FR1]|uniref:Ig-like domain-containing protein n=1 Tax=Paenarthrobacter sp. FR1 TaxID=3439548 RepID=UPI003DA46C7C
MKTELREVLLAEAAAHIRTHPADMERALEAGTDRVRNRVLRTWLVAIVAALVLTAALVAARAFLTQGPVTLESIGVTAPAASLRPEATVRLSAEGMYSDGSRRALVDGVAWASEDPSVAEVAGTGEATALSAGVTGVTATFDGVSGRLALTVTAPGTAPLTALRVTPDQSTVELGGKVQLTAEGSYGDGSLGKLNQTAVWASDRPAVARVDGDGLVTAAAIGTATITASEAGLQGASSITVTAKPPARITGLSIDPAGTTLKQGQALQFRAVAGYSDGSTANLTDVEWSSGDPKRATISAAGVVTAQGLGQVLISAVHVTDDGTQWRAESKVSVEHAVRTVVVGPAGPFVLQPGGTVQLKATVTYTDGRPGNPVVTWASSRAIIATVNDGLVRGGAVQGTVTITASVDGVSSNGVTVNVGQNAPTPGPLE